MKNWTHSPEGLRLAVDIEREKRRRQRARQEAIADLSVIDFLSATKIETPQIKENVQALAPFLPWPAQQQVLDKLQTEKLLLLLKARQTGMSWLLCGYVVWRCLTMPGRTWLYFSKGQLEANELIRRSALLFYQHEKVGLFPKLIKANTEELAWDNRSRILSLAATKTGGRTFTASGVVLDEFGFMQWGNETLAAAKPTIDDGGQLIILSSADGPGTNLHLTWQHAESKDNGFVPVFLDWRSNPTRDAQWRDRLLEESLDQSSVKREYPENALEAFITAAGLVYEQWSDGPDGGNVTEEADYIPDGGPVYWSVDDGYSGMIDKATKQFTATSHPRVFLLAQLRHNGDLAVFYESYALQTLSEVHVGLVRELPYPEPEYAVVDKSAAELKGRLHEAGIYTHNSPSSVEESIKETRGWIYPDKNGHRRLKVHPRCTHLRAEMLSYRIDREKPVKAFDHGPDCLRGLCWDLRHGG